MAEPLDFLLRDLGLPAAAATAVSAQLFQRYRQNNLPYHNLDHIHQALAFAARWAHLADSWELVQLALWFHDIVYDPQAKDNEAQSAAVLDQWLSPWLSHSILEKTAVLIMATQHHTPSDADSCLVVDADLAILAAAPAHYARYAQAIRQEYSWVSDAAYRVGRQQVLETFLKRPFIYHHRPIRDELEAAARHNLAAEIHQLDTTNRR